MGAPYLQLSGSDPLGHHENVRLKLGYLLAWAVATTVVAGVAWLGVRQVLTAPVRTRPAINVATQSARPSQAPAPPGPALAAASTANWTSVSNGRGATAYRRVIRTNGGEASVWAEPGEARVLATTPKAGYTVNIKRLAGDWVEVTFSRGRQVSRVVVRWWDAPYAEVSESLA